MSDQIDKAIQESIEIVSRINRAKFKLLKIAISGLMAIKEQGHPIAQQTIDEMIASIPEELELDVYREIQNALNPIDDK